MVRTAANRNQCAKTEETTDVYGIAPAMMKEEEPYHSPETFGPVHASQPVCYVRGRLFRCGYRE